MSAISRTTYELQIGEDGSLTLPAELRAAMGLQAGDTLTLVQGEGEVWFMPTRLLVPEVAEFISKRLVEKGLTVNDLLAGLAEEREILFKERYGDLAAG